ncbi:MAG: ribosome biogenesis/translation initiation ATPase RLI [Thermofilaceae archaeon]
MRVAVVERNLCRVSKCGQECVRFCPINRSGAKCVWIDENLKRAVIDEKLCVGCGICVRKCPFSAIHIVNLPEKLREELVHRYGPSGFELFRLPIPKQGSVVGIIGSNGVGKSTSLKILSGEIKPNLGRLEGVDWDEIIRYFRGSELQTYFQKLANGQFIAVRKPQEIDVIPKYVKGTVRDVLKRVDENGVMDQIVESLALQKVLDRTVSQLSGGELQKLAIAAAMCRNADVYVFDEPSSYLDVRERLRVARTIRELARRGKYVLVVEHDLALLDYMSDYVHVLYGEPGAYGIVSLPRSVRTGINVFLRGVLKEENIRFRDHEIRFHVKPPERVTRPGAIVASWSALIKRLDGFELEVEAGEIYAGEIVGVVGPNGIGKTTFVRMLVGELKPDNGWVEIKPGSRLSYKPQMVPRESMVGTVREVLEKAGVDLSASITWSELIQPLGLHKLMERDVEELSGGELQRVAIAAALGREADIYLLDEPMAYLDVEQRYAVARVVRRLTQERGVATIVVEHDLMIQDFIADSLMVFRGEPSLKGEASSPLSLRNGFNALLRELGVTFRRDPDTLRPRVNKEDSRLDRYLKSLGEYYYTAILAEESE